MDIQSQKKELALDLYEIGAVKFGEFTYKSGLTGPMYLDLRLFISYPKIMKKVVKLYSEQIKDLKYDRLAGVAYAALPIAGAISLELEKPWIFMRKEGIKKEHGLQKSLEGEYQKGETVLVVEDVVTRATSLMEVMPALEQHGLVVKDAVVLLNYEKGGRELLAEKGYNLHAFMTVKELLNIVHTEGKIDDSKFEQCIKFLSS